MFEGSTASGTEQAYRKAMDKLTELLIAEDAIHAGRHIFSLYRKDRLWRSLELKNARTEAGTTTRRFLD